MRFVKTVKKLYSGRLKGVGRSEWRSTRIEDCFD